MKTKSYSTFNRVANCFHCRYYLFKELFHSKQDERIVTFIPVNPYEAGEELKRFSLDRLVLFSFWVQLYCERRYGRIYANFRCYFQRVK